MSIRSSRFGAAAYSAGMFVAGASIVLGIVGVVAPQALLPAASATPGCFQDPGSDADDDYGSMSLTEQINGSQTQTTLSGIRAEVKVGSDNVPCGRINSVFVASSDYTLLMEFGWAKGFLSCHGEDGTYTDHGNPIPFAVGLGPGFDQRCRKFSGYALSEGNFHTFRASDKDENGYWGGWLNSENLQPDGWALGFHQGTGGVNAERQNPQDPGFAHFREISEVINEDWSYTNDLGDQYDTDPDYHFEYIDQHHVKFSHD